MSNKSNKNAEVDNLLNKIFSSNAESVKLNNSKNNFLLKYSKLLKIGFIALLFAVVGVLSVKNGIAAYLFDEKYIEQSIEEDVVVLDSENKPETETLNESETEKIEAMTDEQKVNPTTEIKKTTDDSKNILPSPTPTIFIKPTVNNRQSPTPVINQQPKTYSIIPISTMNVGSMEASLQTIAYSAYQEFLRTANLNQLDESTQMQILLGIYTRMLKKDIAETQQNLTQLREENQLNSAPEVLYVNPEIETKLDELRQTLATIQNQPVAMNVIEGKKQRAYQDWMENNSEIYSLILSSRYASDLNSILSIYGL